MPLKHLKNTPERYGSFHKLLHWGTALFVFAQFIVAWVFTNALKGSDFRKDMFDWHVIIGATILTLTIIRAIWRLSSAGVQPLPDLTRFDYWTSRMAHLFFYAALLIMPISGYIMVTAKGHDLRLLGLSIPGIIQDKAWGHVAHDLHHYLAYILLAVIAAHILGALRHAFVLKNEVLNRMLPECMQKK